MPSRETAWPLLHQMDEILGNKDAVAGDFSVSRFKMSGNGHQRLRLYSKGQQLQSRSSRRAAIEMRRLQSVSGTLPRSTL